MRISLKTAMFISLILLGSLSVSCAVFNEYSRTAGVTFLAPLGNPEANHLDWSPVDSTRILVAADNIFRNKSQVYILDTQTKHKAMVADPEYGFIRGIWLPDGKHVAVPVSGGTQGFPEQGLWVIDTQTHSMQRYSERIGAPLWLPDGKTIVFLTIDEASGARPRRASIYIMDAQMNGRELVYSSDQAIAFDGASASADGRQVVFSVQGQDFIQHDLYILDVTTRTVRRLTRDGVSWSPQWSPHGNLIVYAKARPEGGTIATALHIMRSDGSCDVAVPGLSHSSAPTWSPDGMKIAFLGEDGLYVADLAKLFGRDIYQDLCP